jgi:hypothetical protein
LAIVASVLAASQTPARILHTKFSPSQTWDPWLPLTIGSGVEFETDKDQSEVDFPMLIEYNFMQTLKLTVEPNMVHIGAKAKDVRTVTGLGDLETSIEYEFVPERRYRPGFTAVGLVRWPTATDPDIGNPGHDYGLGLIASKDPVFVDLDLSALYTFVGDHKEQDTLEVSLAGEWHLNHFFDIEAEVVHTFGTGGILGRPGTISGIGTGGTGTDLTEGTVGVAWHISKRLKVEQGGIIRSDGTLQRVVQRCCCATHACASTGLTPRHPRSSVCSKDATSGRCWCACRRSRSY